MNNLARADGTAIRVLVVDDEPTLAEVLASVLRYEGWEVRTAADGASAVRAARDFEPDAVILDVMLPDVGGLEVLRRLRAISPHVCVLFLTAKDAVEDRIAGITAGGDDYVTKPFSLEEVLARLRGLLRRAGIARSAGGSMLEVGDLSMDEDAREVRRGGELIELTATEFELLRFLMLNPKRVLSKAQILDRVWHYDFGGQAHVVELYISYLRKKVDAGREPMIGTVAASATCSSQRADEPSRRRDGACPVAELAGRPDAAGEAGRRPARAVHTGQLRGRSGHHGRDQRLPAQQARPAGRDRWPDPDPEHRASAGPGLRPTKRLIRVRKSVRDRQPERRHRRGAGTRHVRRQAGERASVLCVRDHWRTAASWAADRCSPLSGRPDYADAPAGS